MDTVVIDLVDPATYTAHCFEPMFDWLRRNAPVYWHEEREGPGFWALTKHRDIAAVYADAEQFSSAHGMRLDSDPVAVAQATGRMISSADPPTHTQLKKAMLNAFTPRAVRRMQPYVAKVISELVGDAVELGELDAVHDLAGRIPSTVVGSLLGTPTDVLKRLAHLATECFEAPEKHDRLAAYADIFMEFTELLDERRRNPDTDFISLVAYAMREAGQGQPPRPLSDEEIVLNCAGVLFGGNETTRHALSGGLLAFAENPGEWQKLRASADAVPGAVEECLRWTTPGLHTCRTATRDLTIIDTLVRQGDRVALWNASANRDEDAFDDPYRFQIDRRENPHLTFGAGRHVCIGAGLARLELALAWQELRSRVARVEVTGTPQWNATNFTHGLTALPIRLHPA